jgi:hypothetical protein
MLEWECATCGGTLIGAADGLSPMPWLEMRTDRQTGSSGSYCSAPCAMAAAARAIAELFTTTSPPRGIGGVSSVDEVRMETEP